MFFYVSRIIFVVVLLPFVCLSGFPQEQTSRDRKAQKFYEQAEVALKNKNYTEALKALNMVIAEDPRFIDAYLLKADIWAEQDSVAQQVGVLEEAIAIEPEKLPKLYYSLGSSALRIGLYAKAESALKNYLKYAGENAPFGEKAKQKLAKATVALNFENHPVNFEPQNMGASINSEWDEYWPSITLDGQTLIFNRLLPPYDNYSKDRSRYQEDFFVSQQVDGVWQPAEPMVSINTAYNEGAQSISADGNLLFFTACTRSDGWGSCDIYFSRKKNNRWTEPKNAGAPVNSASWESQPSISANGEYLYFVSNRKGGKGGMDIWRCKLKGFSDLGSPMWGAAENLGDSINTSGNEMSPYIHADGEMLYFSSDYWLGLGGTDLFCSRLKNDSVWTKPRNLGYPINTYKDEQGLVVNADGNLAYFSSDRPGSKGMDIYYFKMPKESKPSPVSYIKGKVFDKETKKPLCAQVELVDVDNSKSVIKGESCSEKGEFLMCLPLGKEYAFNITLPGYMFYSKNFAMKKVKAVGNPYLLEVALDPIAIGKSAVLTNIFFETASYELLNESLAELQRLREFLLQNRTVKIEIGGHTDNVGGVEYNQKLSENRARAVYNYLVKNGFSSDRISFRGYGYSQPVADNETPEGRALNRRTEIKVIQK